MTRRFRRMYFTLGSLVGEGEGIQGEDGNILLNEDGTAIRNEGN